MQDAGGVVVGEHRDPIRPVEGGEFFQQGEVALGDELFGFGTLLSSIGRHQAGLASVARQQCGEETFTESFVIKGHGVPFAREYRGWRWCHLRFFVHAHSNSRPRQDLHDSRTFLFKKSEKMPIRMPP